LESYSEPRNEYRERSRDYVQNRQPSDRRHRKFPAFILETGVALALAHGTRALLKTPPFLFQITISRTTAPTIRTRTVVAVAVGVALVATGAAGAITTIITTATKAGSDIAVAGAAAATRDQKNRIITK